MDDFMNRMGLGDPDPSNYKTGFGSADEIADWFNHEKETIGGKEIKMQAVIYSNGSQECERMASLIKFLGNDFHEYVLGVDFDDNAFESEFGSEATYPQVSIGYQHIGSMKETLQYMSENGIFV